MATAEDGKLLGQLLGKEAKGTVFRRNGQTYTVESVVHGRRGVADGIQGYHLIVDGSDGKHDPLGQRRYMGAGEFVLPDEVEIIPPR